MEGLYIGGRSYKTPGDYAVRHSWTGETLSRVAEATYEDADQAVIAARGVLSQPLTVHQRYEILENAARALGEQKESFALTIAQEAGKPLRDARTEVERGQQTLRYAAVAARTMRGQEVPVRGNPGAENRMAFTIRKPFGVVLAITPFNFPLNLVLHKVAPAIAAGNSVVLKPAPATPLTALKLVRLLEDAGLPPGWLNVVTGSSPEIGSWLVAHSGVNLISFTGSAAVGQIIRANAGLKPVLLELGSNAANIVHEDADLSQAASILAPRAYAYAGQVCISVQRIYVHHAVYDHFSELLVKHVNRLRIGNPEEQSTDLGPMINESAAERASQWVDEALVGGARAVISGARNGAIVSPWLLEHVNSEAKVMNEEVFAPVAVMTPYRTLGDAIAMVNSSRYGLQAGLFTHDLGAAFYAAQRLEVGGLIVNDSSSFRADNMPYGGVKDSGIGREGPEYAVEEMTYPTVVVFNL